MHVVDIIRRKRDGAELTPEEIRFVVDKAALHARPHGHHDVQTEQIAAWLMAVCIRGLAPREVRALTTAMRDSGEVFDPSALGRFAIDKHSTGGVGDSTSFIVAPIAAAAGLTVPMISGRGLGHTGGTLDKLESIPGYRVNLSLDEFRNVLAEAGCSLIGQTPALAPADRVLYALRDHTGSVESPYLICASIMSKKLASGINGLVLDVKTGSGAFLKREEEAAHLASLLVETGEASGTRTVALLSDMNQPLGRFAGNWLEIWECVEILQGHRHPINEDVRELALILAGWMLFIGNVARTPEEGRVRAGEIMMSGAALRVFERMVSLHGGDASVLRDPAAFHRPRATRVLTAEQSGFFNEIDCEKAGWAVQRLGAGREKPGEPVDAHAGIQMHVKLGNPVQQGDPLVTLYATDESRLAEPEEMLRNAITISDHPREVPQLIHRVITAGT